jgi:excisionase family DNA binding protein
MSQTAEIPTRLAVAPAEAARMLGLGKTRFYELLAANEIASIKLGTRRLIRIRDLEAWLARRCGEA